MKKPLNSVYDHLFMKFLLREWCQRSFEKNSPLDHLYHQPVLLMLFGTLHILIHVVWKNSERKKRFEKQTKWFNTCNWPHRKTKKSGAQIWRQKKAQTQSSLQLVVFQLYVIYLSTCTHVVAYKWKISWHESNNHNQLKRFLYISHLKPIRR